jgi:hypothetical protein
LKLWSGSAGEAQPVEAAGSEATNNISTLWWWVMLFLAIAAVAQSIVASDYLGTQREQP